MVSGSREVRIGLLGLGTVGAGVAKILHGRRQMLEERAGARLTLAAVADTDLTRPREGLDLKSLPMTGDAARVLADPSIQIAGIVALEADQKCVGEIVEVHRKRRDILVDGLNKLGWSVPKPKGTMFVWAPIPEAFRGLGSLEFSKLLIQEARVAVSPGIGFGEYGEGYVRFALVENEQRIRQALRGLKQLSR
jgi:hypothetical protein